MLPTTLNNFGVGFKRWALPASKFVPESIMKAKSDFPVRIDRRPSFFRKLIKKIGSKIQYAKCDWSGCGYDLRGEEFNVLHIMSRQACPSCGRHSFKYYVKNNKHYLLRPELKGMKSLVDSIELKEKDIKEFESKIRLLKIDIKCQEGKLIHKFIKKNGWPSE